MIRTEYIARRDACRHAVARLDSQVALIGWLRVAAVLLAGLAWWLLDPAWWILVPAGLFLVLVVVHARWFDQLERARRAVAFYEAGLRRIDHTWMGTGDTGERFQQGATETPHLYARDLDVFGVGSVFELLGTCRTEAGQHTLAQWLLAPASPHDIRARQQAVIELAPHLDLRERLSVEGDTIAGAFHPDALGRWATAPSILPATAWLPALVTMLPLSIIGTVIWRANGGPAGAFELAVFLQAVLAFVLHQRVVKVIGRVDGPARNLDLLVVTTRLIEEQNFGAVQLRDIQTRLRGEGARVRASSAIARLTRLDALVASRRNVMFAPFAALLLWGTQLAFRIEAWRARHGRHIPEWLTALGEFDALSALAAFAAEHPDFVFPSILDDEGPTIRATSLAHPLLPDNAVANDLSLGTGAPVLMLVSGSNMSGKSTFLRALGVTVVLAQAGAPVRARACGLSPLAVGASIRVADSLQDGQSRFYAEILRLRQIVDLAKASHGRMVFLLDEMLSGTNSHDRRQGADGLLRGLTTLGAIGLATTHDLALGAIADRLGPAAVQTHFSDRFDAGTLEFDYVLRPGPVQNSNALALMRSVGLEVDLS